LYFLVTVEIAEEAAEAAQAILLDTQSLGLEVRDGSLKLPEGAAALPPGKVELRAFYDSALDAGQAEQLLRETLPSASIAREPVVQEDWAESWKREVRATRVGRIWVGPPWAKEQTGDASVTVIIEPGMAFGTGDHPTTQMCLAELDRVLAKRPGASVLDVGCGSGVLSIAARQLGAGRVVGNDIDPIAVRVARENAAINGVPEIEITERPLERIDGTFDVVVANLFSGVLCQLAPHFASRTAEGGLTLTTGILAPQASDVARALEREGMRVAFERESGEWALLAFERRDG
jgi:ribosomal protein L11 methyltransferase